MPPSHLFLCHPLLLPSIFPSIMVFSGESALHSRWPKYWSFSFSINHFNEYSGLISFRIDWFDPWFYVNTRNQHPLMLPSLHLNNSEYAPPLSSPNTTTPEIFLLSTLLGNQFSEPLIQELPHSASCHHHMVICSSAIDWNFMEVRNLHPGYASAAWPHCVKYTTANLWKKKKNLNSFLLKVQTEYSLEG